MLPDRETTPADILDYNFSHLCSQHVDDAFLESEAVLAFANRRHLARMVRHYKAELEQADEVLAPILYRIKQFISQQGRSGRWRSWLKSVGIERSCADRLVLAYATSIGRRYELPSRQLEVLEGDVSLAAHRTYKKLKARLSSQRSKLQFLSCLGALLDVSVENDDRSVRLTETKECELSDEEICKVPAVFDMQEDGTARPVYDFLNTTGASE